MKNKKKKKGRRKSMYIRMHITWNAIVWPVKYISLILLVLIIIFFLFYINVKKFSHVAVRSCAQWWRLKFCHSGSHVYCTEHYLDSRWPGGLRPPSWRTRGEVRRGWNNIEWEEESEERKRPGIWFSLEKAKVDFKLWRGGCSLSRTLVFSYISSFI